MENEKVNVVISDIAPNISGIAAIDLPKHFGLVELALSSVVNIYVREEVL